MRLTQTTTPAGLILRVEEARIDAMAAIAFKDAMRTATQDETGRAILDLSEVTFIDSSGLGAIVAALKQMPDGTALELACLSSAVEKVFSLTRMDTVFKIHKQLPVTYPADV
ncbi:MAG: STAS domain-containing protein [Nereida ignava]|uniref:STAS domain-containing protein n=1 Tax=Nereida ignava TaxID=282199 RepID=UPI0030FCABDE